jgi:hypothetical protein
MPGNRPRPLPTTSPVRRQSVWRRSTGWMARVRFPAGAKYFSLLHGVHPVAAWARTRGYSGWRVKLNARRPLVHTSSWRILELRVSGKSGRAGCLYAVNVIPHSLSGVSLQPPNCFLVGVLTSCSPPPPQRPAERLKMKSNSKP